MRLIFFYNSWKHGFGTITPWNPKDISTNYYAERFKEEGYYLLLKELLDARIVDDISVIIESRQSPGRIDFGSDGLRGYVVPSIEEIDQFLEPGDILFVRGGWRHWHDSLVKWQKRGHWLMLYAANTGRQRWEFWDVVLDDMSDKRRMDEAGRLFFPFRKPINEDLFYCLDRPMEFDIMIGASRVHDRKGQWRAISGLIEHKKMFKENLKAILPGPFSRGVETNKIMNKIKGHGLDVSVPGFLSRSDLAWYMNKTRGLVHLGAHGQGDRGPMEAMASGCKLLIGYPSYHAPWMIKDERFATVSTSPTDPRNVALEMRKLIHETSEKTRFDAAKYRALSAGLQERCLPDLAELFTIFRAHPRRVPGILEEDLL